MSAGLLQFAREVIASVIGNLVTRGELRADELTPGLSEFLEQVARAPQLGPLAAVALATANVPQKIFETRARTRTVFQNFGAGVVRVASRQEDLAAPVGGLRLEVGDVLIDEPPDPHGGEWWAVADTANTVLVAGEAA